MSREEQLSRALARALDQVSAKSLSAGFEEMAAAYREVESAFLPQVAGDDRLVLETKRRVAELILYEALSKEMPPEVCRESLRQVEHLGFADLERKATVYLIYARDCLKRGRKREGATLLEPVERELTEAVQQLDTPVYRHLQDLVDEVLGQMREPD